MMVELNTIFDEIEGFLKERGYYIDPLINALNLAKQGKQRDALSICDMLMLSMSDDPMLYIVKAMFYKSFDKFDKGLECLIQIQNYDDLEPFCAYMKADLLFELERFEETVKWADRAIKGGIDLGAYTLKGHALNEIYEETGDKKLLKDILHCYDKAALTDLDSYTMYKKAVILSDLGRYDEGIECIDEALSIEPENPTYLLDKTIILNDADRYDEAVECAREVIELDIKDAALQYVLGMVLYNLDLLDESLNALNKSKKLDPKHLDPENLEANIQAKRSRQSLK